MKKTFQYRLYPTKAQKTNLSKQLEECRGLYNHFLERKKTAWEWYGVGLSLYDLNNSLPVLKRERPSLGLVHSQVLQNVAKRVDLSFKAFFRRLKTGTDKPGFPRFRGEDRYDSLTFPQGNVGFQILGNVLKVFGVGKISMLLHRPIEGTIKTCTIRRSGTGAWFASFSCDSVSEKRLPPNPLVVGIDMGIREFFTTSDSEVVKNPKYLKQSAKRLAQAQRKLALEKENKEKRKKIVSRIHEKISNQRHDFFHKTAKRLVGEYGILVVEDLKLARMQTAYRAVNRALYDTAWARFLSILTCKAEEAGREFRKVNPAHTSQDCANCGYRQKMPLSKSWYVCPKCGKREPRNVNAAKTIKRLGTESPASR